MKDDFLGGADAEWRKNFAEHPYDKQAIEAIAPPLPELERARPHRVNRTRRFLDFNPQTTAPAVVGVPTVFAINSAVASVSVGGVVPFPVRLFCTPLGALSTMPAARLAQLAASLQTYPLSGVALPPTVNLDSYWVMTPGEILELGDRLDGIEGFFFAPWCGVYGQDATVPVNVLNSYRLSTMQAGAIAASVANGGTPEQWYGPSYDALHPTFGPIFAPVVRVSALAKQISAPLQASPWVVTGLQTGLGGGPVSTVCIPVGARFVTVTFAYWGGASFVNGQYIGQGAQLTPGIGYTPMDAQVYWNGFDGPRHQHPSDQLTAAARGQVSNLHDIEVYEIPRCAAAMTIVTVGATGPVPGWSVSFSN